MFRICVRLALNAATGATVGGPAGAVLVDMGTGYAVLRSDSGDNYILGQAQGKKGSFGYRHHHQVGVAVLLSVYSLSIRNIQGVLKKFV